MALGGLVLVPGTALFGPDILEAGPPGRPSTARIEQLLGVDWHEGGEQESRHSDGVLHEGKCGERRLGRQVAEGRQGT